MNEKIYRFIGKLTINEEGGGLGTLFIGLSVILMLLIILTNIADYSLYTYKRNEISKAMDYAVTAAAQQINISENVDGISKGFSDDSGKRLLEGVEINLGKASTVFNEIFYRNVSYSAINIDNNLLLCSTSLENNSVRYTIKVKGSYLVHGELDEPSELENVINAALTRLWPGSGNSGIYVNGNTKTNKIQKGTYLFAIIKEIEIKGLISSRKIRLSSFAGAKLERSLQ